MSNDAIQFINCNPDDFKNDILDNIDKKISTIFKNHFSNSKQEDLLTRNEVCDFLKINLSTLWAWTKKGKLKSYGISGRVYYKRAEVEAALTELK